MGQCTWMPFVSFLFCSLENKTISCDRVWDRLKFRGPGTAYCFVSLKPLVRQLRQMHSYSRKAQATVPTVLYVCQSHSKHISSLILSVSLTQMSCKLWCLKMSGIRAYEPGDCQTNCEEAVRETGPCKCL